MNKDLGLIGRASGVVLMASLAASGCARTAKLTSRIPTIASQQGGSTAPTGGPAPMDCNPSAAQLPKSSADEIATHFESVVSAYAGLSARERDAMFVDRDVKGNAISYAANPDDPTTPPWARKDLEKDGIPGTSTDRAYAELGVHPQGDPVVVAVIDSAIDVDHEALKDHIWVNGATEASYPGSVNGWNFLGGKNGNVYHTTLEVTRELRRMRALKAASTAQSPLSAKDQAYLDRLEKAYASGKGDAANKLKLRTQARDELAKALDVLRSACKLKDGTKDEVMAIRSSSPAIQAAKKAALSSLSQGRDLAWYKSSIAHWKQAIQLNDEYYYNLSFDSSSIVGDDPSKMDDVYGNANVKPEADDEIHATHVSGIIGAVDGKKPGLSGQAQNVRIMSLRAVPDGDERDKDIGNAIRFAVDHGARVINMSFGKDYSPNRDYVWQQIRYAASKDVLIVHAAGNDSLDNDITTHYPEREVTDADGRIVETLPNMIEVGASSSSKDKGLPADFTDYGARSVDLFAPGVQIYSTVPGNHYAELDGTSMATPEVTGIAALLLSVYPKLTAAQVKEALLTTVTSFRGLMVVEPNPDPSAPESLVDFGSLSQESGVVNAYSALKAASRM
jgi:subtilisin family serine protease